MRVSGKIEVMNGILARCDICKKTFETGDEVKITLAEKDFLGWNCRKVRHKDC